MRTLHLIDIENLIGAGRYTQQQASDAYAAYVDQVGIDADDLVVVACNPGAALATGTSWTGARLLVRSGADGADRALIDVIDHEQVSDRFTQVVCASGDGRFAHPIAQLAYRGVAVTVASRPESLSASVRLAAHDVLEFTYPSVPAPLADVQPLPRKAA